MENTFKITNNILVDNADIVISHIDSLIGESCDVERMVNYINEHKHTIFYIDEKCKRVSPDEAIFAWVDTNYVNRDGVPIFISVIRRPDGTFTGHIVGSMVYLSKTLYKKQPRLEHSVRTNFKSFSEKYKRFVEIRDNEENTKKSIITQNMNEADDVSPANDYVLELANEVQSRLLVNQWETNCGLRRYILVLGSRVEYYVSKGISKYYVMNSSKAVIINTGLLDKHANPIKMMYQYNVKKSSFVPYKLVLSKAQFIENNFTAQDAITELEPVTFVDEGTETLSTDINDFDITYESMEHCVSERKNRLPEELQDAPETLIASCIKHDLETGLLIQRCGGSYAKPVYNSKFNKISWYLPLHINTRIDESPEMVMVIAESNGYFSVKTILPYDASVRDQIRAATPYLNLW